MSSQAAAAGTLNDTTVISDEILAEQLTRNLQFFGAEAQGRVAGSFVVVVGLGVGPLSRPAYPLIPFF